MKSLGNFLRHALEALLAISLLGMVIAVFGNVVLRYFWGTGWVVSEELSRLLFVWLVSLAATLTFGEGKHLGFDLLTERVKGGAVAAALRWFSRALIALAL
jgi:TRAP-type transport system small permease protein